MGYIHEFTKLVTEERNERTMDLDLLDSHDLVARVQSEDLAVAQAVAKCTGEIARAVDLIVDKLRNGGDRKSVV